MKYRVDSLEGALLDAAVALAEGFKLERPATYSGEAPPRPDEWEFVQDGSAVYIGPDDSAKVWRPSALWEQAGPIIERERICISFGVNQEQFPGWSALVGPEVFGDYGVEAIMGPTPLIAAMRAYTASVFGDEVELP